MEFAKKGNRLVYKINYPNPINEEGIVTQQTSVVPSELLQILCPDTLIDFLEEAMVPTKEK